MASCRLEVLICRGPECGEKRFSPDLHAEFARQLAGRALGGDVELLWQSCFGRCQSGPNVMVRPPAPAAPARAFLATAPLGGGGAVLYNAVKVSEVRRVVEEHLVSGRVVRDFMNRG